MKAIFLIHGANLNLLGQRDLHHYGHLTLSDIEKIAITFAKQNGYAMLTYQSNHEGDLIDKLQVEARNCVGIIINPGAFSHYSFALHDALIDTKLPTIEVHLSKLEQRESWRQKSVISPACIKTITGKKVDGYIEAIEYLTEYLHK